MCNVNKVLIDVATQTFWEYWRPNAKMFLLMYLKGSSSPKELICTLNENLVSPALIGLHRVQTSCLSQLGLSDALFSLVWHSSDFWRNEWIIWQRTLLPSFLHFHPSLLTLLSQISIIHKHTHTMTSENNSMACHFESSHSDILLFYIASFLVFWRETIHASVETISKFIFHKIPQFDFSCILIYWISRWDW